MPPLKSVDIGGTNRYLCELLGIDPETVSAVNVRIRPGQLPIVSLRLVRRNAPPCLPKWKRMRVYLEPIE